MLDRVDVNGNPYLGLYVVANDSLALIPPRLPGVAVRALRRCLKVETVPLTLGGSTLVGALAVMNARGLVVTRLASDEELAPLRGKLEIGRLPTRVSAVGNTVVANDRAALVHPGLDKLSQTMLEDVLGVEVVRGTVAGSRTVGSAAVARAGGVLLHPKTTVEERKVLRSLFNVDLYAGTANFGSPMVGAAVVANGHGGLVGTPTTGIELGRIEEALGGSWGRDHPA